MRNIKLVLEYDGTNYYGWQVQSDKRTIQGEIQRCIKQITGENVLLKGAGRTDAGVHAIAQVANFYTKNTIPAPSLMKALNCLLPPDIVVKSIEEVNESFDARRSARGKTYKYLIFNNQYPSALYRDFSWCVLKPLDIEIMKKGASLFIGEKDFSSFRASGCTARHAVRRIKDIEIQKDTKGFIEIEIKGEAFLRHMVRIIVGTLVELGKGKITLKEVEAIINARDRRRAGITAPAKGLFLKEVEY